MLNETLLVVVDHIGDQDAGYTLTAPSAELLTLARTLTTGELVAVALNPAPDVAALARYGVSVVYTPRLADYSPRVPAVVADAVRACIRHAGVGTSEGGGEPAAVMCVSNYRGKEVAARLAVGQASGAVVDATAVQVVDGELVATKSVLSGTWTTSYRVTQGTPIIAVRPSSISAQPAAEPTDPVVVEVEVEFSAEAAAVQVESSVYQGTGGRVALTEARTVVCGGRGTDGDFTLVEQLADALDGAVGATRVCADEGWVERSLQIGQTGVSVAPRLYIGLGVSGAIHHTSGMQSAGTIVAVVDDEDAPIVEIADLTVIGDLREVVPAVLAELG
ncbi:electron transfer flavoprotein subunit alpha/FixB family protein [Buchananella hordeovulneris]|uniref:electron transfer flavoprotein subunit alpha/FixB family protein n=1 Tax=Buchananella hordeovulneris TaxID=52770 RepID=UPI0026DCB63C|nr:electron transfer flavoprotein subunit alpha/FixB family protein [Buchananella hordeovulneris]MDO5081625.1 electron transfer flavoprotein subunit alpha/FixB family protein [Buchananella hordeovulneris]